METEKQRKSSDLQFRNATLAKVAGENGSADKIRMSVSSELPVPTMTYFNDRYQQVLEVLDHTEASIDLSRAKEGLVILDRHNGDQVGLMQVEIRDGKLSGDVEFCTGQRAQEIKADAEKGLRRNVSVGYLVRAESYRLEGERDGIPVVRAMHWTPYEASFEPVPADSTVGVGRSSQSASHGAVDEKTEVVEKIAKKDRKMDSKKMAELFARASKYGIDSAKVAELVEQDVENARSALDALIVEKQERDLQNERKVVVELKEERAKEKPAAPAVDSRPVFGETREEEAKVLKRYSVMNVIRAMAGHKADIGFERELSDELAKQRGKSAEGIIIPHAALSQRDFTVSGTSSATVSTDLIAGEFIDLLRTRSIVGEAGCRFLTGLVGNVAIPKMTAGATGYWVSEGGAITESQPTLGQVTGSPNTCGVMTDISRRLLLQSTPAAEMLVRDEIIERIIRTVQIAVFAGTGADGQPSAITNASGINNPSVTQGTPTYAEILDFPGSIEADNATSGNQKFLMTSEVWAKLAATFTNATYGEIGLVNWANKTCIGYPYLLSEDLPANSLWFGDWSTVNIGVWGNGIDVNVDTATLSSSGGVRIVGLQDVDVMVRQGKALAYNTAVTS